MGYITVSVHQISISKMFTNISGLLFIPQVTVVNILIYCSHNDIDRKCSYTYSCTTVVQSCWRIWWSSCCHSNILESCLEDAALTWNWWWKQQTRSHISSNGEQLGPAASLPSCSILPYSWHTAKPTRPLLVLIFRFWLRTPSSRRWFPYL